MTTADPETNSTVSQCRAAHVRNAFMRFARSNLKTKSPAQFPEGTVPGSGFQVTQRVTRVPTIFRSGQYAPVTSTVQYDFNDRP